MVGVVCLFYGREYLNTISFTLLLNLAFMHGKHGSFQHILTMFFPLLLHTPKQKTYCLLSSWRQLTKDTHLR